MALVELARFIDPMAARIVRGRLAAEGIEAVLFDGGLASLGIGSLTPARLMIEEEDLEAARRVIGAPDTGLSG